MEQAMTFGVVDDTNKKYQTKVGGVFGLNVANITKLELNLNAGKGNTPGIAVDFNVMIGDKEFMSRIFDTTGSDVFNNKNEKVSPGQDGYVKLFNIQMEQKMVTITHIVKSTGVTMQQLTAVLSKGFASFVEWAKAILSIVPAGFQSRPVDVFLEYQWAIKGDNDRTYLTLPSNLKGGAFICQSMAPAGQWEEVKDKNGLHYADAANNKHVFERSVSYMTSNKGVQQSTEETATVGDGAKATSGADW